MPSNSSDEPEHRKIEENFIYSPIREPKIEDPEYVIIDDDDEPPPAPKPVKSAPETSRNRSFNSIISENAILRREKAEQLKKFAEQQQEFLKGQKNQQNQIDELLKSSEEQKGVMKNMVKFMRDSVGILGECRRLINESKGQRDLLEVVKVLIEKTNGTTNTNQTSTPGPSTTAPSTPAYTPIQDTVILTPPSVSQSQIPSTSPMVSDRQQRVPSTFCVFCEASSHHSKDCNTFDTSRKRYQQLTTVTHYCTRCLNPGNHLETHGACPAAEHNDCSFCGQRNADHHAILCPKYPLRTSRGMVKPRNETKRAHCDFCNKDGHDSLECRKEARRAKLFKDDNKTRRDCLFCKRSTHTSIECRTYPTADARRAKMRQEHRCSLCLKKNDSTDPSNHPNCEFADQSCRHCSTDDRIVNHHELLCPENEGTLKRGGASEDGPRGVKRSRRSRSAHSNAL